MKTAIHLSVIATFSLVLVPNADAPRSPGESVDDTTIAVSVKVALVDSDTVDAGKINVEPHKRIVQLSGYCGSMHRSRGGEVLFDAIPVVLNERPEVRFIHSGRTWCDVPLPKTIMSLGLVDDDKVPVLLNSMDVLVVTNRVSSFGSHSYPVKLYEAMSCKVPLVATRTLATEWMLGSHPECLVEPADAEAISAATLRAISQRSADYQEVTSWDSSCDIFERALLNKRS